MLWSYVIEDLNEEEVVVGMFYKKELRKTNQTDFTIKKLIKRKSDKLYIKWKGCDKMSYFPEPHTCSRNKITFELELTNYAIKSDLKSATGVDTSQCLHMLMIKKVLGKDSTQGLDNTTVTAELKYPITFTESGKRFVLILHYIGSNGLLFVNAVKMY